MVRRGAGEIRKVGLVGSSGGHLTHLLALRPWWEPHDRFWVTFNTPDASSRLGEERAYWCYHPTNRNLPNLVRNTLLAIKLLRRERPDVVLSSGAGIAVAFAYGCRLLGIPFIFVEVIDRVKTATLTGRLVQPVSTLMLVQLEDQRHLYREAKVIGRFV